jgi:hypothetical protein
VTQSRQVIIRRVGPLLIWALALFGSGLVEAATRAARTHSVGIHVGARPSARHVGYSRRPYHSSGFYPYRHHAHLYQLHRHYPWYGWGWGGFWLGPAPARVYFVTEPAPGVVETDDKPKKSEVRLDGATIGQSRDYNGTWDRLGLRPGRHLIEFSAPGYMTLEIEIDVAPGGFQRFDQKLQKGVGRDPRSSPLPPIAPDSPGFLRIQVSPVDAVIYLDGEFLARADELASLHGPLPVAPGRHVLEAVRAGMASRRLDVEVEPNGTARIEFDLQPE